jgi:hypothetical protein
MLTMAGNQADSSKIKRLEAALIQSKSEIQSLYVKIEELEKEKVPLIMTFTILNIVHTTALRVDIPVVPQKSYAV